ncbi:MAG: LPS translocon maturation chaperone LptM [Burkholderiales bacterium]|nr:hypothetical protein [Pseudomonadota bacterium]
MRTLAFSLLVILFAAACGHKAPLYLPDPSASGTSAEQQSKQQNDKN